MSTDIITGNDLKAILGEVLPASQGVFCKLLWTNPNGHTNLTCTMGESTVTINDRLSKYDGFIVEFRNYYNAGDKTTEIYFSKCQGMYGRTIISATLSNPMISYGRHWYPVNSSNGFYFSDCTRYTSNAASVVGSDTGCLVPMRIYGFKLYATLEQPLEVADYIVEQGTSGIWAYRKWNSGIAECWGKTSIQPVCSRAFGNIYITQTSNPGVNYPFTFTSIVTENISTAGASGNCWVMAESTNYTALSQAPAYWVCRPTQATAAMNVNISYYTMGTWK